MLFYSQGVDVGIANHVANVFLRDPYFLFAESLFGDSQDETRNFELLYSLNFKMLRFKPPPLEQSKPGEIGWRVEFRPLELQFTDFENTAFATFVILLARTILKFKLDFLISLSDLEENMNTSCRVNACLNEKFHFRYGSCSKEGSRLMTIDEIVNGSGEFKGLIAYVKEFLDSENVTEDKGRASIDRYLKLFEMRANGKLMTPASWMRKTVREHPEYKKDSIVSERINYDLVWKIHQIGSGQVECPELLP